MDELSRLAQQRLEQFHNMFEETRMAEQREQLGRDISRALFQRHGMFTSSPYERDTDTRVFGSNRREQDVINGRVPGFYI